MSNKKIDIKSGIKGFVLSRNYGFYVGLAAAVLTFVQLISYSCMPKDLFNGAVIAACVIGIVLFVVFSLFKQTARLAPVALMICDFLCITAFAAANGMVDYLSTAFFGGFSIGSIFLLPAAMWFSVLMFVLSFLVSSAAMYMPQFKEIEYTVRVYGDGAGDDEPDESETVISEPVESNAEVQA